MHVRSSCPNDEAAVSLRVETSAKSAQTDGTSQCVHSVSAGRRVQQQTREEVEHQSDERHCSMDFPLIVLFLTF